MSDDSPVTAKNYEPFIKKRFEERVSLELTHTYLCRAIQKNQRNPGEKITALTPLNAIQDDVDDSETVTSSSNPDDDMEPSAKRPRASDNPENEKFDSIKSKDPISCDPKAYDPPGPRSNIDSDPVQFETVRDVYEEQAELLTKRFEDSVKLQDIPDMLFCRRISKELSERMEKIELPTRRLTVLISTDFVIVKIYNTIEEFESEPMEIRYQKVEKRRSDRMCRLELYEYVTSEDYKTMAACDIFFLLQQPGLELQKLEFKIFYCKTQYIDISLQKLILKLLERLEHEIRVEKFIYTYSREELFVPDTVTNHLLQFLLAFQSGTLKKIELLVWDDEDILESGDFNFLKEMNFEDVVECEPWTRAKEVLFNAADKIYDLNINNEEIHKEEQRIEEEEEVPYTNFDGFGGSEKWSMKCRCNLSHGEGNTIECSKCKTWQHWECVAITKESKKQNYKCTICDPRILALTSDQARSIQLKIVHQNKIKKKNLKNREFWMKERQVKNVSSTPEPSTSAPSTSGPPRPSRSTMTRVGSMKRRTQALSPSPGTSAQGAFEPGTSKKGQPKHKH